VFSVGRYRYSGGGGGGAARWRVVVGRRRSAAGEKVNPTRPGSS